MTVYVALPVDMDGSFHYSALMFPLMITPGLWGAYFLLRRDW
jgi:hypothetical protein